MDYQEISEKSVLSAFQLLWSRVVLSSEMTRSFLSIAPKEKKSAAFYCAAFYIFCNSFIFKLDSSGHLIAVYLIDEEFSNHSAGSE